MLYDDPGCSNSTHWYNIYSITSILSLISLVLLYIIPLCKYLSIRIKEIKNKKVDKIWYFLCLALVVFGILIALNSRVLGTFIIVLGLLLFGYLTKDVMPVLIAMFVFSLMLERNNDFFALCTACFIISMVFIPICSISTIIKKAKKKIPYIVLFIVGLLILGISYGLSFYVSSKRDNLGYCWSAR